MKHKSLKKIRLVFAINNDLAQKIVQISSVIDNHPVLNILLMQFSWGSSESFCPFLSESKLILWENMYC
ncbi:hypothetical protein B9T38_13490 [Acinetobacter sp. ANC 4218]|jgi:hypothetical protein|nr:hypothetical protein B9T38_13490 [Acinetobacter sp. ANC 4218]